MRAPIALFVVMGVAWLAGLLGDAILQLAIVRKPPGSDFVFVAGWSAGLFGVSVVVAYIPVLYALSRLVHPLPSWMAGLVGLALSVIPLGMLHWLWEGQFRVTLTGSAATIFLPVFAIAGVVFGIASLDRD